VYYIVIQLSFSSGAEAMDAVSQFIKDLFQLLGSKLVVISSDASAVILAVLAIGLILLLFYIVTLTIKPSNQTSESDDEELQRAPKSIRDKLAACRDQVRELQTNPPYLTSEKLYFAVNGIVNSGFILSVALLIWALVSLRNQNPADTVTLRAVKGQLDAVIITLASAMLVSAVVVYVSRSKSDTGRSYERINKAFMISFVIAIASLATFIIVHPSL
jgi:uncharacterized PurR-regulated membrane protein YhhQ (DUF165 family)